MKEFPFEQNARKVGEEHCRQKEQKDRDPGTGQHVGVGGRR